MGWHPSEWGAVVSQGWFTGVAPSPAALDGRRVVVELHDATDPETGGQYTLKRLKVRIRRPMELHRRSS